VREAELERRLREVVEDANDIVYVHDLAGNLCAWSAAGERILGYRRDEALGMNIAQLLPPEQLAVAREMTARKVAGGGKTVYELQLLARDGRRVDVEVSSRVCSRPGEPPRVEGIVRDITERKRLEGQQREAQKLEAVGRLAGGIAHDFNNLLTVINGFSDLILADLPRGDPRAELLLHIRSAGERAAGLTKQLLAFGRKQFLVAAPVDVNGAVRDLAAVLRPMLGEDIDLEMSLQPDAGRVLADPRQIHQIVMNLAVNARDAMPRGGRLLLGTARARLGDASEGAAPELPPGEYVELWVRDTGCGMDEQTRARVFEPFFTTKEVGQGPGLGLATVYGIVKQSGGHISIDSQVGQGTTFRIYLPRLGTVENGH
jgi:PAS domain S-box-containing protein